MTPTTDDLPADEGALLPCPFCGERPVISHGEPPFPPRHLHDVLAVCSCGVSKRADQWNTRAALSAPVPSVVDELAAFGQGLAARQKTLAEVIGPVPSGDAQAVDVEAIYKSIWTNVGLGGDIEDVLHRILKYLASRNLLRPVDQGECGAENRGVAHWVWGPGGWIAKMGGLDAEQALPFSIRLTPKMRYGLELLARKQHSSVSEVVRRALYKVVDDEPTPPLDAKALGEWQPIETAPKDGTEILGCFDDSMEVIRYLPMSVWYNGDNTINSDDWTHWMPLPDAPRELLGQKGGV